jgi:hypothetical protein
MLLEASRPEGASTLEAATGEHGAGPAKRRAILSEVTSSRSARLRSWPG